MAFEDAEPTPRAPASPRLSPELRSIELVLRARGGDATAVAALYARYLPRLRRWARGRLPRRARDFIDTDDLVQDTVVKSLGRLEAFEPQGDAAFMAYLRQALCNRLRDEIRRVDRRPGSVEPPSNLVNPGPSPLEETIGLEAIDRYESVLAKLDIEERAAIVGRIELGLSYEQLAEDLGKPSSEAARKTVARALVRLARGMGHAG